MSPLSVEMGTDECGLIRKHWGRRENRREVLERAASRVHDGSRIFLFLAPSSQSRKCDISQGLRQNSRKGQCWEKMNSRLNAGLIITNKA